MKGYQINKTILLLLLILAIGLGIFALCIINNRYSTLATLHITGSKTLLYPEDFQRCTDALRDGDLTLAHQMIANGKAQAKDSDRYYLYEVLQAKYYFTTMQADSFYHCHQRLRNYLKQLEHLSTTNRKLLQAECYMQRGVYEAKMVGRADSAITYYKEAQACLKELPNSDAYRLIVLTNLADAYKLMGRYDESVKYCRHALELGDSIGMSDDMRITLRIGIASSYAAMKSFEQSKEWWEKVTQLRPKMDRQALFHYLNNRGNDYYLQEKYNESLLCFLELDSILAADSTMHWERMYERANLSDVYIKLGQPERAIPLLDETQPFFTQQNQQLPLFYLTTQRIELALIKGNLTEAHQLIEKSPIPDWMIPEQIQLRRKVLMKYYRQTAQWQNYSDILHDYAVMRDSLFSDAMKMRFSETLTHYQHDSDMLSKQKQIEETQLSLRWAITLFAVSVIVILLLINIIVQKHRARKLQEAKMRISIAALRMETVRNRITPHFISNALTAEIMAQMEGKPVNLDSLVQLLHRGIELTDVEQSTLSEELEFIQFYCNIESRSVGDDFQLDIELADDIDVNQVILPSMMVQILVENAIKHGLKAKKPESGKHRRVLVKITRKEQATLVEVIDNGIGLSENNKKKERTGLRVMRQTIHLLNEQHMQAGNYHRQEPIMDYGIDNYSSDNQETGCRAWLLLPDHFKYTLNKTKEDNHE